MSLIEIRKKFFLEAKADLANNLKNIIKKSNVKDYKEFAHHAGVDPRTVESILNKDGNPSLEKLAALAQAAGVPVAELLLSSKAKRT